MKFENTRVFNFEGALRGMRNPMNSWDKSDSRYILPFEENHAEFDDVIWEHYIIGSNDLDLAKRLIRSGTEHSKFMRFINTCVDITAPIYWWKEIDTYKVGTVANSTSTMHKLASTPITRECFEMDDYDGRLGMIGPQVLDVKVDQLIDDLEQLRQLYNQTKDKRYWKELIRWLPEGWLQTRTWSANYAVLRNIYHQRKNHRLSEWHTFCKWVESLPYSELITMEN